MVRMQNHRPEEVEAAYRVDAECVQIAIRWDSAARECVSGVHLRINRGSNKVGRVDVVRRVGFYVVRLVKEDGDSWGK